MIGTIAGRELRNLFLSPLAWTVLAGVQFYLALAFSSNVEYFIQLSPRLASLPNPPGVTDVVVANLFSTAAVVMLFVVPLLSMRLVSEERRSGTLRLLLSAPVSMTEIVLGKYFGLFLFLLIMVGLTLLMPLSLQTGTTLDFGKMFAGAFGLVLMLGAFAAAGLFMSTLTRHPAVAAFSGFGLVLILWVLRFVIHGDTPSANVAKYFSLIDHFDSLDKGTFNSADVAFYLLFIVTFLVLSIRRLDNERLQR